MAATAAIADHGLAVGDTVSFGMEIREDVGTPQTVTGHRAVLTFYESNGTTIVSGGTFNGNYYNDDISSAQEEPDWQLSKIEAAVIPTGAVKFDFKHTWNAKTTGANPASRLAGFNVGEVLVPHNQSSVIIITSDTDPVTSGYDVIDGVTFWVDTS